MGLIDKLQSKLELYRLEQKYSRRKNRTTFTTGAQYVDGEYIYNTSSNTSFTYGGSSNNNNSSAVNSAASSPVSDKRVPRITLMGTSGVSSNRNSKMWGFQARG